MWPSTQCPQTVDSTPGLLCVYAHVQGEGQRLASPHLGIQSKVSSQHCWIHAAPFLLIIFLGGPRARSTQSANKAPGVQRER